LKTSLKNQLVRRNKQSGSMLIIAVFMIVVIGLLGTSLLRLHNNAAQQGAHDIYAVRAYFAAYSAQQVAINALIQQENANQLANQSKEVCDTKTQKTSITLPADGFQNCDAYYTCYLDDSAVGRVYHVEGAGLCHDQYVSVYREIKQQIHYPLIGEIKKANHTMRSDNKL